MSLESVRSKYEQQLMRYPNVTGVAIGERAGQPVIQVLVTHKVPESLLRQNEIIPKRLEGHAVDVVESGFLTAQSL